MTTLEQGKRYGLDQPTLSACPSSPSPSFTQGPQVSGPVKYFQCYYCKSGPTALYKTHVGEMGPAWTIYTGDSISCSPWRVEDN